MRFKYVYSSVHNTTTYLHFLCQLYDSDLTYLAGLLRYFDMVLKFFFQSEQNH